MARQSALVKIGKEGFDFIDEHFGENSRNGHIQPPQPTRLAPATSYANHHQQQQQIHLHRYHPQESYTGYPPQEYQTAQVTRGYEPKATVRNDYKGLRSMAPQSALVKIGKEGFDLIDEHFGKNPTTTTNNSTRLAPATSYANHQQQQQQQIQPHRYHPQESCTGYPPQEYNTAQVTRGYEPEATVNNSYDYEEAASKAFEYMVVIREYHQRQPFRMPYY